jgi:hypothetical protein
MPSAKKAAKVSATFYLDCSKPVDDGTMDVASFVRSLAGYMYGTVGTLQPHAGWRACSKEVATPLI